MNNGLNTHVLRAKLIGMDSQIIDDKSTHLLLLMRYVNEYNNKCFAEVAVNESSKIQPEDIQYVIINDFNLIDKNKCDWLLSLDAGYTQMTEDLLTDYGLDYLSYNLTWNISENKVIANKLRSLILSSEDNLDVDYEIFVFGTKFQDNHNNFNFGFPNDNGVHNCHMNQLNKGNFSRDNGWHQDGGLIIHNITNDKWTAIFIKFQCQK